MMGLEYDSADDIVTINGFRFFNGISNGNLIQTFRDEDYRFLLPVEDKVVVDVGANIADSSIWLASKGAKQVIAFEPFLKNYEAARRNVELNKLQDVIRLHHAAVGKESKQVLVNASIAGVYAQIGSGDGTVTAYSIADIVAQNCLSDAVLKVDCEGCEYDIILNSDLQSFSRIQIEYHNRGYAELKQHLERQDFKVDYTKPEKQNSGLSTGWVYAKR
jgi:FkbM family methyltransferase